MEGQIDPRFSDLTVTFSEKSQKVHKFVLYKYSAWFKTALDSQFEVRSHRD